MKKKYDFDNHKLWWHLDRVNAWKRGEDIVPIQLDLGSTLLCNQKCIYCLYAYRQDELNKNPKKYSIPRDIYLKLMEDAGVIGVRSVVIGGDGESTLHPATPEAIIAGHEAGLDIGIATNGTLLKDEWLEEVLHSLTWIRFSICCWGDEMGKKVHQGSDRDFDIAIGNLEKCLVLKKEKKLKVDIGVCYLLIPWINLDGLLPMVNFTRAKGADYLYVKQFLSCGKNEWQFDLKFYDECEKVLKEVEKYSTDDFTAFVRWYQIKHRGEKSYKHCYAPRFIMNVSGDGCIYSCCHHYGKEKFKYGDLRESSLQEILKSEQRKEVTGYLESFDFDAKKMCDADYCRHHPINEFLWRIKHPPEHVNFI